MSVYLSRTRWVSFVGVAVASLVLGFTGAKILANEPIGYLAVYTWLGLMMIGVPLILILLVLAAILSFRPKTRWSAGLAIMAGILIVASAFTSFKILDAFGQVRYKHEQMISIGPEVQASLVIYFKHGTTHDQIEDFWQNVLSYPDPRGRGHAHREGIRGISREDAVGGHEGVAITFFGTATEAEREQLKRAIGDSPIVYKVLENVAPANVKKL